MSKPIPVAQFTLDGEYIETLESARAAWRKLGGPKCMDAISRCCRLIERHCKGYRWLYPQDIPIAEEIFANYPIVNVKGYVEPTYTDEEIIAEGLKYKTKKEFREGSPKQSQLAYKRGIIEKIPFEKVLDPYRENAYTIYVYEFEETHSAYVGLTDNLENRKGCRGHKNEKKKSAVLKHSEETGIEMPEPKVLEEGLRMYAAGDREDYWKKWYKAQGWNVLNKAPTGKNSSSLGAVKKVSDEHIRKCAAQCTYIDEFKKLFKKEYQIATRNRPELYKSLGLIQRRTPMYTFTEEKCYEAASKCRTSQEFKRNYKCEYGAACKQGWLKQYWWLYGLEKRPVLRVNGFKIKIYGSVKNCAEDNMYREITIIHRTKKGTTINGVSFHYLDIYDVDLKIPDFEHRLVQ